MGPILRLRARSARRAGGSVYCLEESPAHDSHHLVDDVNEMTLGDTIAEVDDGGGSSVIDYASFPCARGCNAATYENAQCSLELDRIHRNRGPIFGLKITVPFYSEHCVSRLHRRQERRTLDLLELQSLAIGEVITSESHFCQ